MSENPKRDEETLDRAEEAGDGLMVGYGGACTVVRLNPRERKRIEVRNGGFLIFFIYLWG